MCEEDDYVLCMRCQKSFPMDDCKPLPNKSGYGFVYCHNCFTILHQSITILEEVRKLKQIAFDTMNRVDSKFSSYYKGRYEAIKDIEGIIIEKGKS